MFVVQCNTVKPIFVYVFLSLWALAFDSGNKCRSMYIWYNEYWQIIISRDAH